MKSSLRILHVTASRDDVRNVERTLQSAGLKVEILQSDTPEGCDEALKRGGWDAVIAGYEVPGFKPPAGLAHVAASGLDLPYIILSDPIGETAVAASFKAGASDYVRRDDLDRLAPVVKRQVRRAQIRRKLREEEEAFEQSERKYRVLFDSAGDAIYISDFAGNILDANKIACVRYGYTRLELSKKRILDIDPDETTDAIAERMDRIKRLGVCIFERVHTTRNGLRLPVEVSARIIDFGGGKAVLSIVRDIRERKLADDACRESEERLSIARTAAGLGIYDYDGATGTIHGDDRMRELWGIDPGIRVTYHLLKSGLHPDDRAAAFASLSRALDPSGSGKYDAEFRVISRRDGKARRIAASGRVYFDSGRVRRLVGIVQDVTERRRTEEALAASEMKYNRLFAEIADGCALCRLVRDEAGRPVDFITLEINAAFERIMGLKKNDVIGKPAAEFMSPNELRSWLDVFAPVASSGGSKVYEHYSPGNRKYFEGNVFSFETDQFVANFRDITERKKAEETLFLRDAQLVNAMKVAQLGDWEYDVPTDTFTFNDSFYAIFGTTAGKEGGYTMRSGEYAARFLHPEDRGLVKSETEMALTTTDPHYSRMLEHRIIHADGSIGYITVRIFIVKDKNGNTIKTYGVNQNITRQKKIEEALREMSARYQAILSSVPDIIMETDGNKVYTWANQAGRDFFGDDVLGREASSYFNGEQATYEMVAPLFQGGEDTIYVESWQRRRDGRKRLLAWWCRALKDESGAVTGTLSTARDITEKKMMEEFLQWELSLNTAVAELSASLIAPEANIADISRVMLDRAMQLTLSADGFVALVDPSTGECFIQPSDAIQAGAGEAGLAFKLVRSPDGRYEGLEGHALNTGTAFFTNDPKRHPAYAEPAFGDLPLERFLAVPVAPGTELVGQIALANPGRDYADRDLDTVRRLAGIFALAVQGKRADERVRASLKEKTILLKEIHHRIKNNLQVVMSLLNLQSFHLTDPQAKALFKENQLRIRSMALVHERLYQSSDLSHVEFREYITKLAVDLFRAYRIDANTVRLSVKADDVTLGIDASVPCGLIINELLLNSLTHAFPKGRSGCITVGLERSADDQLLLTVADDGVGLEKDFDLSESKSLGFSLVTALAEQLGGAIRVSRENGTKIEMLFRVKE